jgi:hypothetical protein
MRSANETRDAGAANAGAAETNLLDGGFGVEGEGGINLGGDSTGDEGEDLLSELDELERERRVVRSVGRKEGEEQAQVT